MSRDGYTQVCQGHVSASQIVPALTPSMDDNHFDPDTFQVHFAGSFNTRAEAEQAVMKLSRNNEGAYAYLMGADHEVADKFHSMKKIKDIESKIATWSKKLKDQKSKTLVKCGSCGSKVNGYYVDSEQPHCPLCRTPVHFNASVADGIKTKLQHIADLRHKKDEAWADFVEKNKKPMTIMEVTSDHY